MEDVPDVPNDPATSHPIYAPTMIMMGVNQSTTKGYPYPSISSRTAFQWVLEKIVKSNVTGFKIHIVHVQVPDVNDDDILEAGSIQNKAEILLDYFGHQCNQIGLDCVTKVKKGDPTEVLCSEVSKLQPDFLVVGCRGLTPFQRVFLGTISEYCVKYADCPVISIKRKPDEIPPCAIDD